MMPSVTELFDLFARAGGGGSGSGGGGDGGGIIAALGYLPMHWLGALLRKHGSSNIVASSLQQIVGWIIALVYAVFWLVFWRGLGWLVAAGAMTGMGAGLYNWFGKVKQSKLVKSALSGAASKDAAWDEATLTEFATKTFMRYQQDWSKLDSEAMKAYMTPQYHEHAALLLRILQESGRRNLVEDVQVVNADIVSLSDAPNNNEDTFTIGFEARAHDKLVRALDDHVLFTDNNAFVEYWTFNRSGNTWLLNSISQQTESKLRENSALIAFAGQNGMFYSADMGWLFIPERGQLFDQAKFGTSDINNHIVGLYKNTLLMQLYTYVPTADAGKSYLIAQANVPKSYGTIIVRRKKGLSFFTKPRGLEEVKTEWTTFNGKYEVFANSYEQATSFELLNPTYMEQLAALDFEVNIEVVDNVIYLYASEATTHLEHYGTMLDLLNKAFQEMKL